MVSENIYDRIINKVSSKYFKNLDKYKIEYDNIKLEDLKQQFKIISKLYKDGFNKEENKYKLLLIIAQFINNQFNIQLHDNQIVCSLSLIDGYISELHTGEGKTFSVAMASIVLSLTGKVHVVTVNDYLAKRDFENMKPIYDFFEVTSDWNNKYISQKQVIFEKNIVYTSSTELIFDFLRERNSSVYMEIPSIIKFDNCIIDEIDFVLIDNANSSCSVSYNDKSVNYEQEYINYLKIAKEIVPVLESYEIRKDSKDLGIYDYYNCDYVYSKFDKRCVLTLQGEEKIAVILNNKNIFKNKILYKAFLYMLDAMLFYHNGIDYIVKDNEIWIINKENGRAMEHCHFSEELHSAIEVKENTNLKHVSLHSNSISYQVYFNKYKNLVGVSGTAYEAHKEFEDIFNKMTIFVKDNKKTERVDHKTIFFKTKADKYNYMLEKIDFIVNNNQSLLIVFEHEKELLSVERLINKRTDNYKILTNDNLEEEQNVINYAGLPKSIVLSTNLVGRGTDIKVSDTVQKNGGLFVICMNHYVNKRIDNQVRGRTGRQGGNGECLFLSSLEDTLFEYGEIKELEKLMSIYDNNDLNTAQTNTYNILISLQRYVSNELLYGRKILFEFDTIIEKYKEKLFEFKKNISIDNITEFINNFIENELKIINGQQRRKNKVVLFNKTIDLSMTIENNKQILFEDFEAKINEVTEDLASKILVEIIKYVLEEEWVYLNIEFENLKSDIFKYEKNENMIPSKFIIIINEMFDNFKRYLIKKSLENFLTVKKQK